MAETSPDTDGLARACRETASQFLGATRAEGVVSVWAGGTDGSVWVSLDADRPHYAASLMKLPLLAAAYRQHARGEVDLDVAVPVVNRFASRHSGEFSMSYDDDQDDETWDRIGGSATLRWLADRATTHSGNLATNLLLDHVGLEAVASVLADAGCSAATTVSRGIEDRAAREAGLDNTVTAADMARLIAGIVTTLLPPTAATEVESVLARQHYRDGIPAGLPAGTYAANKTGWVDGVSHDVALIRPDEAPAYVLAVCTTVPAPEDELDDLIRSMSRTVWEASR